MAAPSAQEARQRALEAHYMARPPSYTARVLENALRGIFGLSVVADGAQVVVSANGVALASGEVRRGFVDLVFDCSGDVQRYRDAMEARAADFGLTLRMRTAKEARTLGELAAAEAAFAEMLS